MKKHNSSKIIQIFAQNVKRLRTAKSLSQEQLAEICDLHRTYIGMIERCEKNVCLKNIEKLADALEVDVKELFSDN